jgi:hypothetical protein
MLIQPQNYNEIKKTNPKTSAILKKIKSKFPDLLFSDDYNIYQGIIISKKNYNKQHISLEKMGEILGYPCYKDFEKLNRNKLHYYIKVLAVLSDDTEVTLFVNLCKEEDEYKHFSSIASKAREAIKKSEYKKILKGFNIKDIKADIGIELPTQYIIDNLINNKKIDVIQKDKINSILYNLEFSDDLSYYEFEYDNPIHRGILIDLLLKDKYDLLSPFYPLHNKYPKEYEIIKKININLEKALLDILNRTRINIKKKSIKK